MKMNKQHVSQNIAFQASKKIKELQMHDEAHRDVERDILHERLTALGFETSFHAVDYPEAVIHHLSILVAKIDQSEELSENDRAHMMRLAINALRYTEKTTGIRRTDFGFEFYAPPSADGELFAIPT